MTTYSSHPPEKPELTHDIQQANITQEPQKLEESEERFRILFEAAPDAYYLSDLAGTFLDGNRAAEAIVGYARGELIGRNFLEIGILQVVQVPAAAALLLRNREGFPTGPDEFTLNRKDGSQVPVEIRTFPIQLGGQTVVLGVARDMSDQKRTEEQLQLSAQRLGLFHDIDQAILSGQTLETIASLTLQRLRQLVPCRRTGVVLLDFINQEATILAANVEGATQLMSNLRGPFASIRINNVDLDALRQGRQHEIEDLLTLADPPLAIRTLQGEGIRAYLITPLVTEGELIGILNLGKDEPKGFTSAQKEIVREIAGQLAIALQRTRDITARQLAEETRRTEADITAALARIGRDMISSLDTLTIARRLCAVVVDVLGCDCCHTALLDEKSDAFVNVAGYGNTLEQGEILRMSPVPRDEMAALGEQFLAGDETRVIKATGSAQSILTAVLQQVGVHTALCAPLRRGPQIFGVLIAAYRSDREFTVKHHRLIESIAQLASLALANARLVEEIQEANRLKDDFVGAMSHELRTPLNVILGYIELLLEDPEETLSVEQSAALRKVNQHAQELVDLVTNLLDINRLRTRGVSLQLEEVTLDALFDQLKIEIPLEYQKPMVDLRWRYDSVPFFLHTDLVKLKIVLKNLITNALKFTDTGTVTVTASLENAGVTFCVSDTGIGILPEHLPLIFEAFRQVDNSSTRSHGGVGLGLYIARQLLDLLGGTITVESTPGEGSTFRVWIPGRLQPQRTC